MVDNSRQVNKRGISVILLTTLIFLSISLGAFAGVAVQYFRVLEQRKKIEQELTIRSNEQIKVFLYENEAQYLEIVNTGTLPVKILFYVVMDAANRLSFYALDAPVFVAPLERKIFNPSIVIWQSEKLGVVTQFGNIFWATQITKIRQWWSTNWTRSRPITITGACPENYQIRINLPFYSGMKENFADIRFTEDENGGELSYWIESYTTSLGNDPTKTDVGDYAVVWVRRTENKDNTIYLYYGYPDAVDASNGYTTFVLFDDFSGTALDTAKWRISWSAGGSGSMTIETSVNNGVLIVYTEYSSAVVYCVYLLSNVTFPTYGYAVRTRAMYSSNADTRAIGPAIAKDHENRTTSQYGKDSLVYVVGKFGQYEDGYIQQMINETMSNLGEHYQPEGSEWRIYEHWHISETCSKAYRNDVQVASENTNTYAPETNYTGILIYGKRGLYGSTPTYGYVDWIAVRKIVDPEPTVSIGEERVFGRKPG